MWPFKREPSQHQKNIAKQEVAVAEQRTKRYQKLFELEKIDHALDEMVKRSLTLLEPKKHEPPSK